MSQKLTWTRAELFDTVARLFENDWPAEWQQKVRCLLNLHEFGDELVVSTLESVFREDKKQISRALECLVHVTRFPHLVDKLSIGKESVAIIFDIGGREPFECETHVVSYLFKCGANQLRGLEALGRA